MELDTARSFLDRRAAWFVTGSWLLLLVTLPTALSVGFGTAMSLTYAPRHPDTPIHLVMNHLAGFAALVAVAAAVGSSLAISQKQRLTASICVIGQWGVFLLIAVVARLIAGYVSAS